MTFEFATAARVVFGPGVMGEAGRLAREFGSCVLVVTGPRPERAEPLRAVLAASGVRQVPFAIATEPTTNEVVAGAALGGSRGCEAVIGFGGGSAIDAAKAIAAMVTHEGELTEYLEVIGKGRPLLRPGAPFLAIPTTAGAGAEVTRNAVLLSPPHRVKVSLRSAFMLARVALVDPELTYGLPPAVTASTGLDTLTQLIEPFVSCKANPMTDVFCREGIRRVARSLPIVWRAASAPGRAARSIDAERAARADMSMASLLGGLALANAGLGAVHGFAGPLGGMYVAPHGALCAALLPQVLEVNLRALAERLPASPVRQRFDEIGRLLVGCEGATAADGLAWLRRLCSEVQVARLSAFGVRPEDIAVLIEKAARASSMRGNPIELTPLELREIAEGSL